jgi:hypothetical protein
MLLTSKLARKHARLDYWRQSRSIERPVNQNGLCHQFHVPFGVKSSMLLLEFVKS